MIPSIVMKARHPGKPHAQDPGPASVVPAHQWKGTAMGFPSLPPTPAGHHQRADAEAIKRMTQYQAQKRAEERRRREERERALAAESRRRAGETTQR